MVKSKKSNKKKFITLLIIILILAIVFGGIYFSGRQTTLQSTFTPIYCADYDFTCCVEDFESAKTTNLGYQNTFSTNLLWTCPQSASRCEIVFNPSQATGSISVQNVKLRKTSNLDTCSYNENTRFIPDKVGYECTSSSLIASGSYWTGIISGGESIYLDLVFDTSINSYTPIKIVEVYDKLYFCGDAGCTIGKTIRNRDGCTVVEEEDIYDLDGRLIKEVNQNQISYVTEPNSCVLTYGGRHVCGNLEEQCDSDSDCGGHTYGNIECNNGLLQTYGCKDLSNNIPSELNSNFKTPKDPEYENKNYGNIVTSRCDPIKEIEVDCCTDRECGTNAFCDNNPNSDTAFTCVKEKECRYDYDCGTRTECDFSNLKLKKPICDSGTCKFEILEEVDCCSDSACGSGWYCSKDYKCKESTAPKTTCPYSCCESETRYFDKACPEGNECCTTTSGRECKETCDIIPGQGNKDCEWIDIKNPVNKEESWIKIDDPFCNLKSKLKTISIVVGILVFLGVFIVSKKNFYDNKPVKKREALDMILVIAFSGVIGFLAYFLIQSAFDYIFSFWGIVSIIIIGIFLGFFNKIKNTLGLN